MHILKIVLKKEEVDDQAAAGYFVIRKYVFLLLSWLDLANCRRSERGKDAPGPGSNVSKGKTTEFAGIRVEELLIAFVYAHGYEDHRLVFLVSRDEKV